MASQLLRTNIALTGNVKLCCYINDSTITRASLNPISSSLSIIPHNINLINSVYSRDIAKFYKDYANDFYTPVVNSRLCLPGTYNEYVDSDKYETGACMDSCYGMKRVSKQKNGKQFAVFAPIFINSEYELPTAVVFNISLQDADGTYNNICSKTISIEGTDFGNYLNKSYKDINGDDSHSCRIMKLNIDRDALGVCNGIIRGWSVVNPGLINNTTNLPQKLFSRDLTLTEFDSRICDEYRLRKMVMPHIINLCWYFDITDFLPLSLTSLELNNGQQFTVNVSYIGSDGVQMKISDIDFNHYNIKDGDNNILDYLHEYDVPNIRDNIKEHLSPTINGWTLVESNNTYRFNAYLGFNKYNFDLYEPNPIAGANNLNWINYISSTRKTCINTPINDSDIIEGTPAHPEGSVKDFYYNFPELIKKYNIFNAGGDITTVICNGVKYKFDKNYLLNFINNANRNNEESGYVDVKVSDNISMSISCICNNVELSNVSNRVYLIYKDHEEKDSKLIRTRYIDDIMIVFWLPFNAGNDIYSNEKMKSLTMNAIFNIPNEITPSVYRITESKWESISSSTPFYLHKGLLTLVEPTYYNASNIIYSINDDFGYSLYYGEGRLAKVNRYMGWIQPRFIDYTKDKNGNLIADESDYIFYKKRQDSPKDIEEWGNGVLVRDISKDIYTTPFNLYESKWFFTSSGCYIPTSYTTEIPVISGEELKDDIIGRVFNKMLNNKSYDSDMSEYEYVKTLYSISWDMNHDKTKYIIKLELK